MDIFKSIRREELYERMENNEDLVLIDVLSPESFKKAHLPGAVNVRSRGIDEDPGDFVARAAEHIPSKDAAVVTYCKSFSCKLSTKTARALGDAGYTNVHDFKGGLEHWMDAGYPIEGESV